MNLDDAIRLSHLLLDLAGRWDKYADDQDTDNYAAGTLRGCAQDLRNLVREEVLPQ